MAQNTNAMLAALMAMGQNRPFPRDEDTEQDVARNQQLTQFLGQPAMANNAPQGPPRIMELRGPGGPGGGFGGGGGGGSSGPDPSLNLASMMANGWSPTIRTEVRPTYSGGTITNTSGLTPGMLNALSNLTRANQPPPDYSQNISQGNSVADQMALMRMQGMIRDQRQQQLQESWSPPSEIRASAAGAGQSINALTEALQFGDPDTAEGQQTNINVADLFRRAHQDTDALNVDYGNTTPPDVRNKRALISNLAERQTKAAVAQLQARERRQATEIVKLKSQIKNNPDSSLGEVLRLRLLQSSQLPQAVGQ